ncbi:MAG: glycosyltransferase [Chloroflexi bacterium]|nr:glycosyltransferase [Chloroflexota bacterium]
MTSDSPEVTVLMSVYNGGKYLEEAIKSILSQTLRDFEFVIINDGSTDGTAEVLARYAGTDCRLRVYHQENQGVSAARNRGFCLARGQYIAIMDADDVSLPARLAREVQFMEAHPDVGVVGTRVECMDGNGRRLNEWHYPMAPNLIGWHMIFRCCLADPSVMMRRDIVAQLCPYDASMRVAADYDMWIRALPITRLANLPEVLLRHRLWPERLSARYRETQEETTVRIMHSAVTRLLGREISMEAVSSLRLAVSGTAPSDPRQAEATATLIQQICEAYLATASPSRSECRTIAHDAGWKITRLAVSLVRTHPQRAWAIMVRAVRLHPLLMLELPARLMMRIARLRPVRSRRTRYSS